MTYSHMGNPTLPSALRGFTSEFGKGSGGSLLLLSPANCYGLVRVLFKCLTSYQILHSFKAVLWTSFITEHLSWSLNCCDFWIKYFTDLMISYESNDALYTTVWVLYSQASRAISIGQLHTSPHFHIQPINVVVFNGSLGGIKPRGNLILR